MLKAEKADLPVVDFVAGSKTVEIKLGLSFVSIENAKENLEKEIGNKSFETVKADATATWENLLSKIQVSGGTERQKELFYSCLYRSFLWPALRSDANGEYTDVKGAVVKADFQYYTLPSLWDDYRNKLVLLGMISPNVTVDVIRSLIDRGEKTGFIPTFFHGDHASAFIAGSYLRGLRGYDIMSYPLNPRRYEPAINAEAWSPWKKVGMKPVFSPRSISDRITSTVTFGEIMPSKTSLFR